MVLVDANVMLDVLTGDPVWQERSERELALAAPGGLAINAVIYAELCPAFRTEQEIATALAGWPLHLLALPCESAWLTAQAFAEYRRRGGSRTAPLPDFFIGAHAQAMGMTLLTRDATRYRTYFPSVPLICPS